jgi:hypothetical protein
MAPTSQQLHPIATTATITYKPDFPFLKKLFEKTAHGSENCKFETNIMSMAEAIANELGINNTADMVRIECAVFEFINYRRFYLRSATAGDQTFPGSVSRNYSAQMKTANEWAKLSNMSLNNWNNLIRELEIKYNKRFHNKVGVFVQNNIQNNTSVIQDKK